MAALPAGSFQSKQERQRGVEVGVESFCLDRAEVTIGAFRTCVKRGHCTQPDEGDYSDGCSWFVDRDAAYENFPMNCIDYARAEAYCKNMGKRLPSADELEWAQRGGPAGTTYPWGGDRLPRRVCARANKHPRLSPHTPTTCATGSCPAGDSPQGIHDLAGGVAEWTSTEAPGGMRWTCGALTSCEEGSVNRIDATFEAGHCSESDPASLNYEGIGFRCAKSFPQ